MAAKHNHSRAEFSGKFGVIAAAAGSAIGLGNIWKFPYIAGINGGAAFLFVYVAFILAIGIPLIITEFVIGRKSRKNTFGAFRKLALRSVWQYIGVPGIVAAFLILSFYGVVAGWSLKYIEVAVLNGFNGLGSESLALMFASFMESHVSPVVYLIIFMFLTGMIVIAGVRKGIEKNVKIMMPLLFLIIIILCIRAVTLPGASEGLKFLFNPDFSKLTGEAVLMALGQAFFSLSLGMGILVTYGSYIGNNNNLISTAVNVSLWDTLVAILAGVAIFPAVFAFGIEPGSGPGLVFITLPNIFQQMTGGYFFAIIFFVLLAIAALTSSISLLEVIVAYCNEELGIGRKPATVIVTVVVTLLGIVCSLSLGMFKDYTFSGLNFFDLVDHVASNILLPVSAFLIAVFAGWKLKRTGIRSELEKGSSIRKFFMSVLMFLVKFVAPVAIVVVFLNGMGLLKF